MRLQEGLRSYLLAVSVAVAIVAADLVTKRIAAVSWVDERITVIPGALWFTYHENPGASFSMFQNGGPFLAVAAVIAVGIVLVTLRTPRPTAEVIGFGLIMGGATGNLADRIFRAEHVLDGKVIDWIQLPNFPIFNIADSAVTVAVVVLFVAAWVQSRSAEA